MGTTEVSSVVRGLALGTQGRLKSAWGGRALIGASIVADAVEAVPVT